MSEINDFKDFTKSMKKTREINDKTRSLISISLPMFQHNEKTPENIMSLTNSIDQNINGAEKRKWAFKPGNPISDFLACTRKMALIIGSNLFVHAGILPEIAGKYSINKLNEILSSYLFNILEDESYDDILKSNNSPLWNRDFGKLGNDKFNDEKCKELLEPLNKCYPINNILVGHTPFIGGIKSTCKEKLWFVDVGLSNAFKKFDINNDRLPQVLQILNRNKV